MLYALETSGDRSCALLHMLEAVEGVFCVLEAVKGMLCCWTGE
jgi:hypothetical protein